MEKNNMDTPKVTIRVPGCGCGFIIMAVVLLAFASTIRGCMVDIIHAWNGETSEDRK